MNKEKMKKENYPIRKTLTWPKEKKTTVTWEY